MFCCVCSLSCTEQKRHCNESECAEHLTESVKLLLQSKLILEPAKYEELVESKVDRLQMCKEAWPDSKKFDEALSSLENNGK